VQQGKRLVHLLWKKVQEYSNAQGMPPRSAAPEKRGWSTKWEVMTYIECGGCKYKGTKM